MQFEKRERVYRREEYYWGKEPNELAKKTLEFVTSDETNLKVIDIGAGEGRDAVFFAEQGFEVYATDISPNGLEKAERLADEREVDIHILEADANDVEFPEPIDVVYSTGTLQYIRPNNRQRQFEHFRRNTTPGGLHVLFAFVDHPEIPTPPDWTANEYFYDRSELQEYYAEWNILDAQGITFEDESGGEPHKHAAEILTVRKPV